MNLVASSWIEIPSGKNLLEALAELGAGRRGWIEATGHIDEVELHLAAETPPESDEHRKPAGRFTVLSLLGPSTGPFTVTLARAANGTTEIQGGVLLGGRSGGMAALFVPTDDTAANTDRAPRAAPAKPQAATAASGTGIPTAWVSAVRASALRDARGGTTSDEDDGHGPQEGDLVEHFAFGLCDVLRSDGERLHIRDVNGPTRVREVSTTMLKVMPPTEHDGKKLYRLLRRT